MWYSKPQTALTLLLSAAACTCVVVAAGRASQAPSDKSPTAPPAVQDVDGWWTDLAATDEAKASRALLAFPRVAGGGSPRIRFC
jgi:hypothetical protein